MAVFPLLADPSGYRAETWDLSDDQAGRTYWLDKFSKSFEAVMLAAEQSLVTDAAALRKAIDAAKIAFETRCRQLREQPATLQPFTVSAMDYLRLRVLDEHGLQDPFLKIKHQENTKACAHYRRLIKAHEKLDAESRVRVLTEGIFAGNVFDPGVGEGGGEYSKDGLAFYHTLDDLPERPWLVDDYDAWRDFLVGAGNDIRRAMLFVDNAGADFVLGCLPLAHSLAKQGATVVLAANGRTCYNDMTVPECRAVLTALAEDDEVLRYLLRTGRIRLVSSGGSRPQLDFRSVSSACSQAAGAAQLLILVGQDRTVVTNWDERFNCATLKIALLKDRWIAEKLGGKQYDLACRFEPAPK